MRCGGNHRWNGEELGGFGGSNTNIVCETKKKKKNRKHQEQKLVRCNLERVKHVSGKRRTVCEVGVVPVSKTKVGEHGSIGYYFWIIGENTY